MSAAWGNGLVVPAAHLGPRPVLNWISLDLLVVDERYQRRVNERGVKLINKIVKEFAWSRFQPLVVTGPDASGDFPVIDGQHRLEACRRHPAVTEAPCWIVAASAVADQARAFVSVNKDRLGVTAINVFWARLAAGDPDAVWLRSICDQAGVQIGRVGTGRQPPLTTIALAGLL
ncbi:MAG: ParB N-terminal domain-containing protein, partial [Alphaproteobacteria bacterium]|nr:ParB N-terminal domain-containing protein [Alphaproteobacteria bacterium]